jgi:hypothetical protein
MNKASKARKRYIACNRLFQATAQAAGFCLSGLSYFTTHTFFDDRLLDAHGIIELAQHAHSMYVTQKPAEQADLLKKVLSNCSIEAVSLYPTYRKPFDLICQRVKNEEWSGREDLSLRPPGPETAKDVLSC